jgi:hypothetical protein
MCASPASASRIGRPKDCAELATHWQPAIQEEIRKDTANQDHSGSKIVAIPEEAGGLRLR